MTLEGNIMLRHATITIGDRAYFPASRLGDTEVYRRTFEVVAFRPGGLIVCRRRHDGLERTVSGQWWERYAIDPPRSTPRAPLGPLPLPELSQDRSRPGFYVSARSSRHPGRYLLLAGPFDSTGDARRYVPLAQREHNARYDDPWCEVGIGTCRIETGERDGIWNAELVGRVSQ